MDRGVRRLSRWSWSWSWGWGIKFGREARKGSMGWDRRPLLFHLPPILVDGIKLGRIKDRRASSPWLGVANGPGRSIIWVTGDPEAIFGRPVTLLQYEMRRCEVNGPSVFINMHCDHFLLRPSLYLRLQGVSCASSLETKPYKLLHAGL